MKDISAAIFIEKGKVLLAKRNSSGTLPGYWEFPGGKREENETIFDCLEREIKEEFNVNCRALKIFAENIFKYEHGTIKLIAIFAELIDKNIVLNVHDEYKWVEINNLLDYKLAPADIYIAQLLFEKLDVQMEIPASAAAILLASGFSKRFGERNKLLVPFRGKPLARYTLELVTKMNFPGGVYFVVASDEVAALVADLSNVRVIKNTAPEKGLRESVRLGVEAAGTDAAFYLFFPCDQPFLDIGTVQGILDVRENGCIVEPRYRGKPGNPCLFSAVFREELISLDEGETPRLIKARRPEALRGVEVSNPLIIQDIDDEETFERLITVSSNPPRSS